MKLILRKRKNKKLNIGIILIIMSLLLIGIGFSQGESRLDINGVSELDLNMWNIYFENISVLGGDATVTNTPKVNSIDPTLINFGVKLKIGGSYSFKADITNSGAISAKLQSIELGGLTETQKNYFSYTVTYENGTEIKVGDLLPANSSKKIIVTVTYLSIPDVSQYPQVNQSIELYCRINYVQEVETGSTNNLFDIHFKDVFVDINNTRLSSDAKINALDPTKIDFGIKFSSPGQSYSFRTTIINDSSYNSRISTIKLKGLTDAQKEYMTYDVTYTDGSAINENDVLKLGSTIELLVTITYKSNLDLDIYPTVSQVIPLEFAVDFVQE